MKVEMYQVGVQDAIQQINFLFKQLEEAKKALRDRQAFVEQEIEELEAKKKSLEAAKIKAKDEAVKAALPEIEKEIKQQMDLREERDIKTQLIELFVKTEERKSLQRETEDKDEKYWAIIEKNADEKIRALAGADERLKKAIYAPVMTSLVALKEKWDFTHIDEMLFLILKTLSQGRAVKGEIKRQSSEELYDILQAAAHNRDINTREMSIKETVTLILSQYLKQSTKNTEIRAISFKLLEQILLLSPASLQNLHECVAQQKLKRDFIDHLPERLTRNHIDLQDDVLLKPDIIDALSVTEGVKALLKKAKQLPLNEKENKELERIIPSLKGYKQIKQTLQELSESKSSDGLADKLEKLCSPLALQSSSRSNRYAFTLSSEVTTLASELSTRIAKTCKTSPLVIYVQRDINKTNYVKARAEKEKEELQKKAKLLKQHEVVTFRLLQKQVFLACLRYHAVEKSKWLHSETGSNNALNLLTELYKTPVISLKDALEKVTNFLRKENSLNDHSFTTYLLKEFFDEKSGLLQIQKIAAEIPVDATLYQEAGCRSETIEALQSADRFIAAVKKVNQAFKGNRDTLATFQGLTEVSSDFETNKKQMEEWSKKFAKHLELFNLPEGADVTAIQAPNTILNCITGTGRTTMFGLVTNKRIEQEKKALEGIQTLAIQPVGACC